MTILRPITKVPASQSPPVTSGNGGGGMADAPLPAAGGGGGSVSIPIYSGGSMGLIVPPGGFAGFAQQTPAVQAMFQRSGRVGGKRSAAARRRKRKTATKTRGARAKVRKRTTSKRKARLVKGSAAAKRYMASIRRKRK